MGGRKVARMKGNQFENTVSVFDKCELAKDSRDTFYSHTLRVTLIANELLFECASQNKSHFIFCQACNGITLANAAKMYFVWYASRWEQVFTWYWRVLPVPCDWLSCVVISWFFLIKYGENFDALDESIEGWKFQRYRWKLNCENETQN